MSSSGQHRAIKASASLMEDSNLFDDDLPARQAISFADRLVRSMPESDLIVSSPQTLQAKKQRMLRGPLIVLSDFDKTLTTQNVNVNGELVYGATTFSVFNDEAYFSRDFVKKTQEEYEKYVAYEFSDTLSHAEKVEYLEEWFASFFTRLTRENVSMEVLEKVASKAVVSFRQGTFHLLRLCQLFGVPFLVLSAGISQVIEKLLEVHAPSSSVTRGLEIGANHLVFDEGGRVQDFSKPVIHSLNKLESFREFVDASYRKHFDDFPPEEINVILLGDHIGDAHLASCFPREANVIKIGFLNHFEQSLLQTYKETFDVVAMNDGSMRVVIELLLEVFKAWPHV